MSRGLRLFAFAVLLAGTTALGHEAAAQSPYPSDRAGGIYGANARPATAQNRRQSWFTGANFTQGLLFNSKPKRFAYPSYPHPRSAMTPQGLSQRAQYRHWDPQYNSISARMRVARTSAMGWYSR